jgi:hypothetical protein
MNRDEIAEALHSAGIQTDHVPASRMATEEEKKTLAETHGSLPFHDTEDFWYLGQHPSTGEHKWKKK